GDQVLSQRIAVADALPSRDRNGRCVGGILGVEIRDVGPDRGFRYGFCDRVMTRSRRREVIVVDRGNAGKELPVLEEIDAARDRSVNGAASCAPGMSEESAPTEI